LEGAYHNDWNSNNTVTSAGGGLIFRYPRGRFTPFAHALAGEARARLTGDLSGTDISMEPFAPNSWGLNLVGGVGLDYELTHHWAIRLVQADYERLSPHFGTYYVDGVPLLHVGTIDINATRLSAGIVYNGGSFAPPTPITLACSASPVSVFPGEPVTLTATAGSVNPKASVVYSWSGANVSGNAATATVATDSLAPGPYTVNCGVKEGRAGKEGRKPWEIANASTSFTVKQFEPPTIGCSASPSTIKPGEVSTVTSTGVSPQNRPLTYSYTAAAGSISGSGPTATFNSQGAPTGPVGITCNVTDDKGQTASGSTTVSIEAPVMAVAAKSEALCSITFNNDKSRPARVDNEAKACLDEVALDLQKQSDAKVVVVGNAGKMMPMRKGHRHAMAENLAAQRAINTKAYLVNEKGIDASRISVATGTADDNKVEDYLVPSGANFATDVTGTTPVDETVVKPQVRISIGEKHHHHHKAHKKM
jgi:outer membrane protein OmpA-like peptidoglycan-associated protein